jgi:DNA-binding MarR family transcriptional regulator
VADRLPLPTLLSFALVAFTIEVDNEFEHQLPHRTSIGPAAKSGRGPWLTSFAMWSNFMQYVAPQGVPLADLEAMARMTNLAGLTRWEYITVQPNEIGPEVVRPTKAGRSAQQVWRPLAATIEQRWTARFGAAATTALRDALRTIVAQLDAELPRYLPVVRGGLFTELPNGTGWLPSVTEDGATPPLDLAALVSQLLLTFTVEFEHGSPPSLPISGSPLRVLDETGARLRDLPRLTGISTQAIAMSLGTLERQGHVVVEVDPSVSRTKRARLTAKGAAAQDGYRKLAGQIEAGWPKRFGVAAIDGLRDALEALAGDGTPTSSPLFEGLTAYPDGWRASVPARETLPHHPAVLHRGGYPDGA